MALLVCNDEGILAIEQAAGFGIDLTANSKEPELKATPVQGQKVKLAGVYIVVIGALEVALEWFNLSKKFCISKWIVGNSRSR